MTSSCKFNKRQSADRQRFDSKELKQLMQARDLVKDLRDSQGKQASWFVTEPQAF